MRPKVQGTLVAGAGFVAAHLAASGAYAAYLKEAMRFPLLVTGMAMVVLGALTLGRSLAYGDGRSPGGPADHDHGADGGHTGHGPRAAWLLLLPLLALAAVDPPALGADAARRDSATAPPEPAGSVGRRPLPPPRDGAVDLPLGEFVSRAYYDRADSLAGVSVRLTGFVVRDPDVPDGYRLTRFAMACCAGDALALQVTVRGLDAVPPPDDTWVTVVGRWLPPPDPTTQGADRGAALHIASQTEIPPPAYPYE